MLFAFKIVVNGGLVIGRDMKMKIDLLTKMPFILVKLLLLVTGQVLIDIY